MRKCSILILIMMLAALVVKTAWAEEVSDSVPASKGWAQFMMVMGWKFENGMGVEQDLNKALVCYESAKKYYDSVEDSEGSEILQREIDRVNRHLRGDYSDEYKKAREAVEKYEEAEKTENERRRNFWQGMLIMLGAALGARLGYMRKNRKNNFAKKEDITPEVLRELAKRDDTTE